MNNSLRFRILILLSLSGLFATILVAVATLWIFERSLARSLDSHLAAYTDILVDELSVDNGELKLNQRSSMLANVPHYWQVSSSGKILFKSSNLNREFPLAREMLGEVVRLRHQDLNGKNIFAVQSSYLFPENRVVTLTFGLEKEVAERYLEQERNYLKRFLYRVLTGISLLLLVVAVIVSHIAVRPIRNLHLAVQAVQTGKESRVKGQFPTEIAVLTTEINRLLDYLSNALLRSRTFAANLSHSLKTPLTVIQNESIAPLVREKTEAILNLVDRNLARASAAGTGEIIGVRSKIGPVVKRALNGFSKIYPVETEIAGDEDLYFLGDEIDLFELLGNIIENACRFATACVRVTISQHAIIVEDDGPGIPKDRQQEVLRRGLRLDDANSGSGLGLAIAKDIAELYLGEIELDSAVGGGLKVTIKLPIGR